MALKDIIALKKYEKALQRSTGLEKLRLLMRSYSVFIGSLSSDDNAYVSLSASVDIAQMYIADIFYGWLRKLYERLGSSNVFDKLAEEVSSKTSKDYAIRSRLSGIALGVVLFKASNMSEKRINESKLKQLIDSLKLDDEYKKELLKMTKTFIRFAKDEMFGFGTEGAMVSQDLGEMAYAALDTKTKKGHYADPAIATQMYAALTVAYKETPILNHVLKQIEEASLIE